MADATRPPTAPATRWQLLRADIPAAAHTEKLVRETWRHYAVARLAEAQFGPDSLEASLAHSRALTSYRELRGSLRALDPYYRPPAQAPQTGAPGRHLKLVRDDSPPPDSSGL